MKKLLFLIALVALIGCENAESEFQNISPFLNATAYPGESVVVRGVSVTLVSIADGRCPSDMMCYWGGWATAVFETKGLNFSLTMGESKEFSSAGSSFRLTLIDVVPYPSWQDRDARQKAVFFVEML